LKLLILGSEGFIGSHVTKYFLEAGNDVFGVDLFEQPAQSYTYRKVSRLSPELDEVFSGQSFNAVINAAGSGNVPYSMSHPLLDFEANCLDVIRVLDMIRKYQPTAKYIHLSSAAVYGNPVSLPVTEDMAPGPLSPYGWHKLISENICCEYANLFGLQIGIVRPFSVYGPGLKKQLFWDIYQRLKLQPQLLEMFGKGDESRDFIYITDMVAAIDHILKSGRLMADVYNLATGTETTIYHAVETFVGALGLAPKIAFNNKTREGDPKNWKADISKLAALGFKPKTSLTEGLDYLSHWIKGY